MQPITIIIQDPTCSAQSTRVQKSKARLNIVFCRYYMHRGLPCSSAGLSSSQVGACGPPRMSRSTFSSSGKIPPTTGPTCDDMRTLIIYLSLIQESTEKVPKQRPLLCPIFFLDTSQNYESKGTSFIIFGALNREL
jgi:hypothetical protein